MAITIRLTYLCSLLFSTSPIDQRVQNRGDVGSKAHFSLKSIIIITVLVGVVQMFGR